MSIASAPRPYEPVPIGRRSFVRARGRTLLLHAWPLVALLASTAFYLWVGTDDLRLPGLQYDEAFDAVPILEALDGREPSCVRSFSIFGWHWPLMIHPHIGPTSAYVSLIAFSVFGASVESLRGSQLAVGVLTLLLLFAAARSWFDDLTAAIAVLLCASAPAFVWWNRAGANWTGTLLPIAVAMLLLLVRWWRTGSAESFVAAAFLLGLGVTTKILFVWLLPAIGASALLEVGPRRIWGAARSLGVRVQLAAAAALVLGLLPFLVHNVATGDVFENIAQNALSTKYGHQNTAVLQNVGTQSVAFARMLDGDTMLGPSGWRIASVACALALISTLVLSAWRRSSRAGARETDGGARSPGLRLLLAALPLTVVPLSTLSPSAMSATYLFIIVPFVWLLLATVLADALRAACSGAGARWRRVVLGVAAGGTLAAVLANHVVTNQRLLDFFAATGGRGVWSDSVFTVADELERSYAGRPVVAMDWGLARSIEFLTRLDVDVQERFQFGSEPSQHYPEECRAALAEQDAVYLVRAPHGTMFPRYWEACRAIARANGADFVLERTFYERDGQPNTFLYVLRPTRAAQ